MVLGFKFDNYKNDIIGKTSALTKACNNVLLHIENGKNLIEFAEVTLR